MKVEQKNEFKPVTLTLESQDEVNKIFALLNHVQIACAVDLVGEWEKLSAAKNEGYLVYHKQLSEIIG